MAGRIPDHVSTHRVDVAAAKFEEDIAGEAASALRVSGQNIERALAELSAFKGDPAIRKELVQEAADAVYKYFVQRELLGLMSQEEPIRVYQIPNEVLARVGCC